MSESTEDWTLQNMAEMIQQRVRPGEWAAELGTSIEQRDGLLIVMQRRRGVSVEVLVVPEDRAEQLLAANADTLPQLTAERVADLIADIPADDVIADRRIATLDGVAAT